MVKIKGQVDRFELRQIISIEVQLVQCHQQLDPHLPLLNNHYLLENYSILIFTIPLGLLKHLLNQQVEVHLEQEVLLHSLEDIPVILVSSLREKGQAWLLPFPSNHLYVNGKRENLEIVVG